MLLTGHADQVFTLEFNPSGDVLASGSHDKNIFLWRTYGECENFMVMCGHKNAVLELHWTGDGESIASCSPDKTLRVWDALTSEELQKYSEHTAIVNSCCTLHRGPPLIVTGSDDRTARVWDLRTKKSVQTIHERFPITSVAFSDSGDQIYTAGIENVVKTWDLRKDEPVLRMHGHSDTVTGLSLSPSGTHLLSNSMDNTLRVWDIRPFALGDRCEKVFTGHQHGFEKNLLRCAWSPDGKRVSSGSADRLVYIWNAKTGEVEYRLPGHSGSVNSVVFHPKEPIVASACSDKTMYLGELV